MGRGEDKQDPANSRVVLRRLDAYDGQNLFPFDPYYGLRFGQLTFWIAWQKAEGPRPFDMMALFDFTQKAIRPDAA